MSDKVFALVSVVIIPEVIDLIVKNDNLDDIKALELFYKSKTYNHLIDEDSGVWHYSPLTIYNMLLSEIRTGHIMFPEGI